MRASSLLALKLLNRHRVVDSSGLLRAEFSFLEARKDWGLARLAKGYDHESESIG